MFYKQLRLFLDTQLVSRFLKKVSQGVPEFAIPSGLKNYLHDVDILRDLQKEHTLTEGRNFKTSLKENYAASLDSC